MDSGVFICFYIIDKSFPLRYTVDNLVRKGACHMTVDTTRVLAVHDVRELLSIISDTLSAYEYPTSSIFSALSLLSIFVNRL